MKLKIKLNGIKMLMILKKLSNLLTYIFVLQKTNLYPLSILEALSMSIPVVGTNVGDVAYVLNKIKCGFIVRPNYKILLKQLKYFILIEKN